MSSCILHLQTPLDCLKESYPSTRLVSERNLKNEVESSTSQPPAPVQDSEPPRDQEKNSGDETEVRIEISNNEAEQGHTGKLDEYDLSLDILIALRKGTRFTTFVKSQWYSQGHSEHILFTKVSKTRKIAILIVYVDDIVLTGDDPIEISQLKQRMGDEFEIKDLENLKYFLGMEVARSKEGNFVSQRKYTLDLLTETVWWDVILLILLLNSTVNLKILMIKFQLIKNNIKRLVCKLITYLISFVVSVVS
ncbi:putative mitochondrial protein [Cucumis melo var. makuwa]|uniref:Putative mitochondrial protein n=1 Tax=Cucumis melo var. makuwa TaxID=1194695 RepID=A0A5D3C0T7_CUCMM|nr:putative mitochondrial protein [Cucumis melo var. makuwa]